MIHKIKEINGDSRSWVAAQLAVSQEWFSSIKLIDLETHIRKVLDLNLGRDPG
jgi:hypothetical protein